ncbi:MAG TPA: LacI family DNA-binding transcriptional regulator [Rectinemataceae bacterium]|nr:LacI family DNA-binding transcriptional regulator [Rectinemataceae bacterium]
MSGSTKLNDVAARAGVSLSTASLVLSDQGRISPLTRERVLEAARELGYKQRPRKQKPEHPPARDIAVLLDMDPEWSLVLYLVRPIIVEFELALRQAGFNTVLVPISRRESTAVILEKIRCSGAVGVATIHFASPELILLLESADIPVVVVMNSSFQDRFHTVCVDDFQGAYEGASYLIRSGHQRLAYVDCVRPDLPVLSVDRFFGFKKAMEEFHLDLDDSMRISLGLGDEDEDTRALQQLGLEEQGITALFVLDDELAVRVHTLLGKRGIRVPHDISIIAPGDMLDYSLCYVPQITTMRIDTTYMGRIAAQMLLRRITHSPEEIQVLKVKQQLVKRGSVIDRL